MNSNPYSLQMIKSVPFITLPSKGKCKLTCKRPVCPLLHQHFSPRIWCMPYLLFCVIMCSLVHVWDVLCRIVFICNIYAKYRWWKNVTKVLYKKYLASTLPFRIYRIVEEFWVRGSVPNRNKIWESTVFTEVGCQNPELTRYQNFQKYMHIK